MELIFFQLLELFLEEADREQRAEGHQRAAQHLVDGHARPQQADARERGGDEVEDCLLYTSDAADE